MTTTLLTPTAISAGLHTQALPRTIVCHGTVGTTMDLARELLKTVPEDAAPVMVTAEEQTAGRGRMGRSWVAPAGSALLFSIGFRPRWLTAPQTAALVWMAATALCDGIRSVAGVAAGLKWPNDVLLPIAGGYGKTAGILIEVVYEGDRPATAIIGCGINVSAAPPPELTRYPATSIVAAAGRPIDRLELLRACLVQLDYWYTQLRGGAIPALQQAWSERLIGVARQPV
ncbi:MAG: biotin--[acetyl-CoA-carboxylase] ligase [Oscillochloris sp.]|nr:biotin--[acetyl-CoA-carboxylase] ligase [Oscillochloris sp.]